MEHLLEVNEGWESAIEGGFESVEDVDTGAKSSTGGSAVVSSSTVANGISFGCANVCLKLSCEVDVEL